MNPGTLTATQSEEKFILDQLNKRLAAGTKLLQDNNILPGKFNLWLGSVRFYLRKIYGEEVLVHIPQMKAKVSQEELVQMQIKAVKGLEAFICTLQALLHASYGEKAAGKVFIGHGQSLLWRELKDFISDRLGLQWDEFNREAVAGLPTFDRIVQMLIQADFAFLIMTAEDEHADSTLHARENVVHEVGLFQGKLGPRRAIILLEEGCREFSNIVGLTQIRFPKGRISASFEDVRLVLEREGII